MSGAGVLLLSKMLISRLVIIWIHDFLLTLTFRNNFLKLFEIKLNILHCRNVGMSFHTDLFIQSALLHLQEGFLSFPFSSVLNVIMQKIKCRGPVLPLHCGRCGLHLCLIRHPCALHLPSAFETRSRTSSRTRELSFHGTPSFQLLIRAEAQCRAAFADCCRPAQHLVSSWPRGGWLRHALVAVFIERHHRDYLSLIICLMTHYITFLSWNPESGIPRWHSKRLLLARICVFPASDSELLWSSEFPVVQLNLETSSYTWRPSSCEGEKKKKAT